ncbi:MAG TPA: PrsW family glutamic-type intramembrane protease [Myxococcales bacterium]|jgi:RsiW-degrading membrane proteinase PrsW (M82 family)
MTGLLLAASALVPAFLLLWFLYSRDKNPEPKGMVAKAFLLGAVIVLPVIPCAMGLEALGKGLTGMWGAALVSAFLGAAIPEEAFKLLVLRGWAWRKPAFDEPMDGMVYGAAASLGFAAFENVMYVGQGGLGVAALRAFTAVPGHALTGVLMGAYVGRAKFGRDGASVFKGFMVAMVLHGLYDTFLFTKSGFALLALVVLIVEIVWAKRLIRSMRDGQSVPMVTVLSAPAPAMAMAGAGAEVPAMQAPVAAVPVQRPTALPRAAGPSGGTGWPIFKILAGGAGASLGSLFILLVIAVWLEGSSTLASSDVVISSAVIGIPTALFLLLFWSGIRGLPSQAR